jgi:ABC-type transport system involved in multi-copper enzyme maturation permease subunit
MISTYLNSMHEGFAKRTAMVLIGLAVMMAYAFNRMTDAIIPPPTQPLVRATTLVMQALSRQLVGASAIWILVTIFAAAPLFASTLEKGWLELIFSKGTPRWQIFLGRFLAGTTMYMVTFAIANFPLAIRLWWTVGIPTWRITIACLLETLALVSLLSLAALASLLQRGAAMPMLIGTAGWFVSGALEARKVVFFGMFTSEFSHTVFDWIYNIMPKCSELHTLAIDFVRLGKITSWWPVWSTALFAACTMVLTMWRLERKSF